MVSSTRKQSAARPRPGGRSARVRAAALAAGLQELAQVGYHDLTLGGIARRAGVHKTTLYRRWGTREALILDAMRERARQRVPVPDTGSLRQDLLELARAAIANATTPEVEGAVRALPSLAPHHEAIAAAGTAFWAERLALDGEIVERARARGEIATDVEPGTVIEAVLGPAYMRLLVTGRPLDDEFIEATVNLIVDGLRPRPDG